MRCTSINIKLKVSNRTFTDIQIGITFRKLSTQKGARSSYTNGLYFFPSWPVRKIISEVPLPLQWYYQHTFASLNFSINVIRRGHFRILEASIVASCIHAAQNRADDKEIVALSQNIHLESSVLRWQKKLRQYRVPVKVPFTINRPMTVVFVDFAFPAQFCQSRTQIGTLVVTVNNNRNCFVLEHQLSSTLWS